MQNLNQIYTLLHPICDPQNYADKYCTEAMCRVPPVVVVALQAHSADMNAVRKVALAAAVLAASLQTIAGLERTRVTASNKFIGYTADTYGINAGHSFAKSNWEMWLDRLGVITL